MREAMKTNLRFITTKLTMTVCKPLKTDRELDIAGTHDILYLELRELGIKA